MALSTPHKQRGFLSVDGVMWIMLVTIALGFIAWMGYKMLGNSDAAGKFFIGELSVLR